MYNTELFNKKKLFLRYNTLSRNMGNLLTDKTSNLTTEESINFFDSVSEVLSRASFAYEILIDFSSIEQKCIQQFQHVKQYIKSGTKRVVFETPVVRQYISLFMPFINTLFILQDRIMPIMSIIFKVKYHIPNNKKKKKGFKKNLLKFPTYYYQKEILDCFPEEVRKIVRQYWEKYARRMRSYRNLDQHLFDIIKSSYYQIIPNEKLIVTLPDNPESTGSNLIYKKNINAYDFLKSSFQEFHSFVEKLARVAGFKPTIHQPNSMSMSKIDLENWPDNTTLCISLSKSGSNTYGLAIHRGEGFPTGISIEPIPQYRAEFFV